MGKTIGKSLNYGYPGALTRAIDYVISAMSVKDGVKVPFGVPVVRDGAGCKPFESTSTADDFIGVSVAIVKQPDDYATQTPYYGEGKADVLNRGGVAVMCTEGTPAPGGKVYIVPATGAFSATETGNIALDKVIWATDADANKIAEITILERKM